MSAIVETIDQTGLVSFIEELGLSEAERRDISVQLDRVGRAVFEDSGLFVSVELVSIGGPRRYRITMDS